MTDLSFNSTLKRASRNAQTAEKQLKLSGKLICFVHTADEKKLLTSPTTFFKLKWFAARLSLCSSGSTHVNRGMVVYFK